MSKQWIKNGKRVNDGALRSLCSDCPCGCPSEYQATLAGIEAAICTDCVTAFTGKAKILSITGVDGVHTAVKDWETDTLCRYRVDTGSFTWRRFSNAKCTITSSDIFEADLELVFIWTKSSSKITSVYISGGVATGQAFIADPVTADLGDSIANTADCLTYPGAFSPPNVSYGGTVKIEAMP